MANPLSVVSASLALGRVIRWLPSAVAGEVENTSLCTQAGFTVTEKGQARCRAENQLPVCLLCWLLLSRFNWLLFYQEIQDSGQDSANHSSASCSASRELAFLLEPPQCPAEPGSICILALRELGGGTTHLCSAPSHCSNLQTGGTESLFESLVCPSASLCFGYACRARATIHTLHRVFLAST